MLTTTTRRVEIPHESGNYFDFRLLTGAQLDDAEHVKMMRGMESARKMQAMLGDGDGGDDGMIKKMLEDSVERARDKRALAEASDDEPTAATGGSYDADTLIKHGLAGWSGPNYDDVPFADQANVTDMIDAHTRDWAADTIEEMNTRPPVTAQSSDTR